MGLKLFMVLWRSFREQLYEEVGELLVLMVEELMVHEGDNTDDDNDNIHTRTISRTLKRTHLNIHNSDVNDYGVRRDGVQRVEPVGHAHHQE